MEIIFLFLLIGIWNFINTNLGYTLISLVGSAVIATVISIIVTRHFSKKVENLQKDLSGLIITEITKREMNVCTDKDGKPYKNVSIKVEISGKANITGTGVKKE